MDLARLPLCNSSKLSLNEGLIETFLIAELSIFTCISFQQSPEFDLKASYCFQAFCIINKTFNMGSLSHIVRILIENSSYWGHSFVKEKEILDLWRRFHRYFQSGINAWARHHYICFGHHRIKFLLTYRVVHYLSFKLILDSEMRLIKGVASKHEAWLYCGWKLNGKWKDMLTCRQKTLLESCHIKYIVKNLSFSFFCMGVLPSLYIELNLFYTFNFNYELLWWIV